MNMIFSNYFTRSIVVWAILILGIFIYYYYSYPQTKVAYEELINCQGLSKEEPPLPANFLTQQTRYQVSKQIFYQKGGHRMQARLNSNQSDIIYSKKKGELIERFQTIHFMMQDKPDSNKKRLQTPLLNPQQVVRYFKAAEATCSYKNGQLEAKETEIAHYLLPQGLWPNLLRIILLFSKGKHALFVCHHLRSRL